MPRSDAASGPCTGPYQEAPGRMVKPCLCEYPPGKCALQWFPRSWHHLAEIKDLYYPDQLRLYQLIVSFYDIPYDEGLLEFEEWSARHLAYTPELNAIAVDTDWSGPVGVNPALLTALQPTIHNDGVMQSLAANAVGQLAVEANAGGYQLSPRVAETLVSAGIPAGTLGANTHAHPAHATIERYLYKVAWPGLIPEKKVAVFQAKAHKKAWLPSSYVGPFNYTYTGKDSSRWEFSSLPLSVDAEAALVWDVGQFLSPEDVGLFHQRYPNIKRVYWGVVVPPETRDRLASTNPWLYELEYRGDEVVYKMEGSSRGAYVQPATAHWWLGVRNLQVVSPAGPLRIVMTPLETYFAHHLVVSDTSARYHPTGLYSVTLEGQMRIPQPWLNKYEPPPALGEQLVPCAVYQRVWQYLDQLDPKKREARDVAIKVRNESAVPGREYIRMDTWYLLTRSALAMSKLQLETPCFNEYDTGTAAFLAAPLLRWLSSQRVPDVRTLMEATVKLVASRFFPRVALTASMIDATVQAVVTGQYSPFLLQAAKAILVAHLTTLPLAALGLGYTAGLLIGAWLRSRDRLQLKAHAEVAASRHFLNFGPDDLAVKTRRAPLQSFGGEGGVPPPPNVGPPPDGWYRWRYNPELHCSACGLVAPCACATCPVHGITDEDWVLGQEHVCCAAVRLGREAEEEFQRTRPAQATEERRHRPNATGRARDPSPPPRDASPAPSLFSVGEDSASSQSSEGSAWAEARDNMSHERHNLLGLDGEHITCKCPQHASARRITGAEWTTCPAGHGFWRGDPQVPCHVCSHERTAHQCECPEHDAAGLATLCQSGYPHVGAAGASCHACEGERGWVWAHEVLGIPNSLVASCWHPQLRLSAAGPEPSPYLGSCAVEAMASHLETDPSAVWAHLALYLPPDALQLLLPSPGLDERAFHVFGLVYRRRVILNSDSPTAPRTVGMKHGKIARFVLTTLRGVPHWEYSHVLEKSRMVPLNRIAQAPDLGRFLVALEGFVSSHGEVPLGSWAAYTADSRHCHQLVREMRKGICGIIKREQGKTFPSDFLDKLDACLDLATPREVRIRRASGLPGCGKSDPYKQFLAQNRVHAERMVWLASLPRHAIMEDWRSAVPLGNLSWLVNTYELGLRRQANVLILDELSLYPPGYVDLFLLFRPTISHVILLGDRVQSRYFNPELDSQLAELPNEADRLFTEVPYCWWMHRSPQCIARALGLPSTNPNEGRIMVRHRVSPHYPLITVTDAETKAARRQGMDARSVASTQGATHHTAQLMVNKCTISNKSQGDLLSAATRVTDTLILVVTLDPGELPSVNSSPILHALMNPGQPLNFRQVFRQELQGARIIEKTEAELDRIREKRRPQRASGQFYDRSPPELAPWLTHLNVEVPVPQKIAPPSDVDYGGRTHLPRAHPDDLMERVLADLKPRELRELRDDQGLGLQFPDRDGFAAVPLTVFPQQKASDPVLHRATVRKRLTRASPEDNHRDYHARQFQAATLLDALVEIAELPPEPQPFDPSLFEECVHENEFVKLTKKTRQTLLNNVRRSDPLWKLNLVEHFVKSQVKAKTEALGKDAKAGQTLALCTDAVVLIFGPIVRYLRRKVMDKLPGNIFCNCGKSLADQSRWSREWWVDKRSTTSDYTGYDATQRGESIGMEYGLMRHFGLHEAWVLIFDQYRDMACSIPELYLDWKLGIVSNLIGPKQSGRDTGEPGTYDFNTYYGLALVWLMYRPRRGTPLAVGGDDMALNDVRGLTGRWLRMRSSYGVIAKVEHTDRPEFCGYYLTAWGCYKNPSILALKLRWHQIKGDEEAVAVSYAAEAHTAYAFGDRLADYCSWTDLEALGWIIAHLHERWPAVAAAFFAALRVQRLKPVPDWVLEEAGLGRRALRKARASGVLEARIANLFVGGFVNETLGQYYQQTPSVDPRHVQPY